MKRGRIEPFFTPYCNEKYVNQNAPEELRKIGDFDDKTDEELEKMSDFLARYSVIIYRVLQTAKQEGRLEEITKL